MEDLKDMVARTLEAKGVLGRIKAEIRAAVYTTIDEQERAEGVHLENSRLTQLRSSPQGLLMLSLVDDFLQYYDLRFSRSTFSAESGMEDNNSLSREKAAESLGLPNGEEKPLLLSILEALASDGAVAPQSSSSSPRSGKGDVGSPGMNQTYRGNGPLIGSPGEYASDSFDDDTKPSPGAPRSRTAEIGLVMDTEGLRAELEEEEEAEVEGGGGTKDVDELDAELERELASNILGGTIKQASSSSSSPSHSTATSPNKQQSVNVGSPKAASPPRAPPAQEEEDDEFSDEFDIGDDGDNTSSPYLANSRDYPIHQQPVPQVIISESL